MVTITDSKAYLGESALGKYAIESKLAAIKRCRATGDDLGPKILTSTNRFYRKHHRQQ